MTVPVQLMTAMTALHIPMTSRPALVAAITSGALHGTLTNGAYMVLEADVSAYVTANPGVLTPPAAPAAPSHTAAAPAPLPAGTVTLATFMARVPSNAKPLIVGNPTTLVWWLELLSSGTGTIDLTSAPVRADIAQLVTLGYITSAQEAALLAP